MDETRKLILVVEDDTIATMVAQQILEGLGCRVDSAKDGQEAVTLAVQTPYDAIYMDIGLPRLTGVEACIAIREHEKTTRKKPVPIIAVTANYHVEERPNYLRAGMNEVLQKPFTPEKAAYLLSFCQS